MNKLRNTIKDNGKGLIGFMLFTAFFFVFAIMIDTAFAQVNDTIDHGNNTANPAEGTIANPGQNSTESNSNPPQSMEHHTTTLGLNSIPSIVNVSQSIKVTGSLIDANTTDGIPGATIKFDGDGVTNPGSVSTDNQGSFSFNTTALPDIHKGLKAQAHFAGDLPSQQYTYGHSPSDSNIRTYDTTNICPNPPGCKTSPSITITSVSNIKPKGTTTNATRDYTVTVDWGDGTPLSNGIQLNSDGSWGNGQVTHKYKSADVGNNLWL